MLTEEEKFAQIPEHLKPLAEKLLTMQAEELPEVPEKGKWYRVHAEGLTCAFGDPYHATVKFGNENKLLIIFCGGGAAVDEYTAGYPNRMGAPEGTIDFYAADIYLVADVVPRLGMGRDRADNPFHDWNMLFFPYATADFHTGQNDFPFVAPDGTKKVLHHRGYTNYRAVIEKIRSYFPAPDKLVVTGFSAGAFGTALLTDDIMDVFSACEDVTCYPDSALLLYSGWHETASRQWGAPKAICDRLISDNITLDSLLALHKKRTKIKIAFSCSVRDNMLCAYQHYFDYGEKSGPTAEDGNRLQRRLKEMCEILMREIPDVGLFIFDTPAEGADAKLGLTAHCVNLTDGVFETLSDGVRCIDWIWDCVNGNMKRLGLELLNSKEEAGRKV